ncbi:50S ribosomal protein L15 [Candidatus Uhrbacteria bacterium]|nr:50S ribosomal protein L15 [Candidatus Uhrbacteria bacterium]
MAFTLHNLHPAAGATRRKIRVGRGNASGRGTYSTRGAKGQRARSGGRRGLKLKGLKRRLLNLPKIGGFRSKYAKPRGINVSLLEEIFQTGDKITLARLRELKLVDRDEDAKILGDGELKKKITVVGIPATAGAKKKIEAAGGAVEERDKKSPMAIGAK